jgi:large subunit ribosomal protein L29
MTNKEIKELRNLSNEELLEQLSQLRIELRNLRTKIGSGGVIEKPSRIKAIKKRIARILTILNERELGINV